MEILFTLMGPGCKTVTRVDGKGVDVVVGLWHDGRIGTCRGLRSGHADFGATVFGKKRIAVSGEFDTYELLVDEIARFFKSGQPPVSVEQTLEIYAFMEAANESKRRNGSPISISAVLERSRRKVTTISNPED